MYRFVSFVSVGLLVVGTAGCAGPQQARIGPEDGPHLGAAWFAHRAQSLGLTPEAAEARDRALPTETPPPDETFDATTGAEAAALWRDLCASCHGAQGRLEGVPELEPAPRKWGSFGVRMGFFFGGDKMRAGIYRKIAEGSEDPQPGRAVMPPWGQTLSREQIWALVRHIEGF